MSGFALYAKHSVWDFVLCAIASSALCYSSLIAFLATVPFQEAPWVIAGLCTLVTAALFIVAYNFTTALVGSIALVAVFCVSAGVCWSLSPASVPFEDVVGNNVFLVFEVALSSVAVFVLSRRKPLVIVLLVGGLILCASLEYLYWNGQFVSAGLFCMATICLYAYRNYQLSLIGSDSEDISFGSSTFAAGVVGLLSVLLATGVFMLVIAPLEPPNVTVKLLTKHMRVDEKHVAGTGDEESVINIELFSWNDTGTESGTGTSEGESAERGNGDRETDDMSPQATAGSSFNIDNTGQDSGTAIRIAAPDWMPIAIPLIIVALIALVIAARKLVRRSRCNRIRALPSRERVEGFYLMFVRAFGKMKMAVPDCQTLREYVNAAAGEIGRFEGQLDNVAFAGLTETYSSVVYGHEDPSDEQLASFDEYYGTFYRNARKYVGPIRYLRLFFRI